MEILVKMRFEPKIPGQNYFLGRKLFFAKLFLDACGPLRACVRHRIRKRPLVSTQRLLPRCWVWLRAQLVLLRRHILEATQSQVPFCDFVAFKVSIDKI